MNLILEKSECVEWYTYLDEVFSKVPELCEYNWLISDLELNYCPDSRLSSDPVIIDGKSLCEIVLKDKIQFIWAVLSGFKNNVPQIPDELPFADGNKHLWVQSPKPQIEGADLEIVCWDSTCTLFIGVSDNISTKLREMYFDIKDLDVEIKKRG